MLRAFRAVSGMMMFTPRCGSSLLRVMDAIGMVLNATSVSLVLGLLTIRLVDSNNTWA